MSEGRVLIVDPEPIAVELMQRRLRSAGFDTAWASCAKEAFEAIERSVPDVILLAAALPDADGLSALVRLRSSPLLTGISIAIVAALGRDAESLGRALELGADDYLRKPVDSVELVARVRSLSRQRRHMAELERKTTRLAELNAELERVAVSDALTGLMNRRHFETRIGQEVERARRYGHALSLVMGDVDFFKKVNDTYGHPAGDEVLRVVGRTILKTVRRADLAVRFGGEEFIVVTPSTDLAAARIAAERVRTAIAEQAVIVPAGGTTTTLKITMSFGVATLAAPNLTSTELLAAADEALYRAKRGGRNRVELAVTPPAADAPTDLLLAPTPTS